MFILFLLVITSITLFLFWFKAQRKRFRLAQLKVLGGVELADYKFYHEHPEFKKRLIPYLKWRYGKFQSIVLKFYTKIVSVFKRKPQKITERRVASGPSINRKDTQKMVDTDTITCVKDGKECEIDEEEYKENLRKMFKQPPKLFDV